MSKTTDNAAGYCRSCDYDLRGLPEKHRCPECGRAYDLADPRSVRSRPRRGVWKKARWVVYPLLVIMLAASAGIGWTYWEWKREQPIIVSVQPRPVAVGVGPRIPHIVGTRSIAPGWIQRRAGRWGYLLERAATLSTESDRSITAADLPLSRLPYLSSLWLHGRGVGDDLMGEVGRLRHLEKLTLERTSITDEGLRHLLACRNLERLDLGSTAITDTGLEHLIACRRLQVLLLGRSRVGDKGLAPLAEHPELTVLSLINTNVDDRAIPVLKGLTKLKDLDLTGTKITPAGAAELRSALPNCRIISR